MKRMKYKMEVQENNDLVEYFETDNLDVINDRIKIMKDYEKVIITVNEVDLTKKE